MNSMIIRKVKKKRSVKEKIILKNKHYNQIIEESQGAQPEEMLIILVSKRSIKLIKTVKIILIFHRIKNQLKQMISLPYRKLITIIRVTIILKIMKKVMTHLT